MSTVIHWLQHETGGLLVLCLAAISVLLVLIIKVRIEPFIALVVTGFLLALAAGLPVDKIVGSALKSSDSVLEKGFGGILGHIAVIIGLGTVLGALLEKSGGADVLSSRLLRLLGERGAPIAMGLVGLIFGIPVFFDIGIFVLAPLVYVTARRGGRSLLLYALPVLAGLSMTHAFLPPHPGPTAVAGLLGVDLGWLIMIGLACGLPAFAAAGILWPLWIAPRIPVAVPDDLVPGESSGGGGSPSTTHAPQGSGGGTTSTQTLERTSTDTTTSIGTEPSAPGVGPVRLGTVLLIIAVPLVLILGATFGTVTLSPGNLLSVLTFLGTPAVALTIAVLLAFYTLGIRRGQTTTELAELTSASLRPVGMILLVVGAGAFFGAVISATGVGTALATTLSSAGLPVLVLAYVISCGLRLAQGSATVAIVTTGGIVAPLVTNAGYSQPQLAVLAVAISAGSIIASHVNDGGFWIVAKYFNMTVKQTLKTWTVLETILSLVGFAMAGILWALL